MLATGFIGVWEALGAGVIEGIARLIACLERRVLLAGRLESPGLSERAFMPAQTNAPLPEGLEVGGYRIVKKISSGGFSIVYLATDDQGNSVAIKEYLPASLAQRRPGELLPYIAPENLNTYRIGLKCFFEEGRALASIYHPNIVRVLNFFRANETVYMVMKYESGRSLQEHVLRNRSKEQKDVLSERFIRRVFAQVMNGLREVHSNRLLHLDVKPANVYLRMDGTPILLDFGAARQTLQRDISKTYPMYTPGFAAPELYKRDAELGPWTDVYSIGACIYACMSGMPPQESDARLKEDKMPTALRAFRGLYSNELISMIERCLRLNSLERPQTVYAVQKELLQTVPERPEFTLMERTGARFRNIQARVTRFMKDHNITWF
jgi:eukaryotic-like serine/threonine-protein kinase